MRTDEVRKRLRTFLHQPLPEAVWAYLAEQGHVQDYLTTRDRPDALTTLAAQAERLLMLGSGRRRRRRNNGKHGPSTITRPWALARVAAAEIACRPDVFAFRQQALRDGLVPFNGVPEWITGHAGRRGMTLTFEVMKRSTPSDPSYFRAVKVIRSPTLVRLSELATQISRAYAWEEWEAVYVLLTGERAAPIKRVVVTTYSTPSAAAGLSRIVLSIDPTTSPELVVDYYSFARRHLVGTHHRAMSEKHMFLAAIVAERPKDETLAAQMKVWNRMYPTWRYSSVTNFGRDRIQARRRLMDPNYNRAPDPQQLERADSVLEDRHE